MVPPLKRWIPTRGFSIPVGLGLTASAMLVVLGGMFLYVTQTLHGSPVPQSQLIFPITLIAVFAVVIPLFSVLRRPFGLSLSPDGVELVYPLRRVRVPWGDLMRVRSVTQGVVVIRVLSDKVNRFGGAYWISLEQARAILTDPRCPAVSMGEDYRKQILGAQQTQKIESR